MMLLYIYLGSDERCQPDLNPRHTGQSSIIAGQQSRHFTSGSSYWNKYVILYNEWITKFRNYFSTYFHYDSLISFPY